MTHPAAFSTDVRVKMRLNPGWLLLALTVAQVGAIIALYVFIGVHHIGALHFAPVAPTASFGSGYPY